MLLFHGDVFNLFNGTVEVTPGDLYIGFDGEVTGMGVDMGSGCAVHGRSTAIAKCPFDFRYAVAAGILDLEVHDRTIDRTVRGGQADGGTFCEAIHGILQVFKAGAVNARQGNGQQAKEAVFAHRYRLVVKRGLPYKYNVYPLTGN